MALTEQRKLFLLKTTPPDLRHGLELLDLAIGQQENGLDPTWNLREAVRNLEYSKKKLQAVIDDVDPAL
jgi:hypothetical protein